MSVIYWFRRDLRLKDNHGLYQALTSGKPVVPVFIFDPHILDQLKDKSDRRVQFIFATLRELQNEIPLRIYHGDPVGVFKKVLREENPSAVYTNEDYEPYATLRDQKIASFLQSNGVIFKAFKDQVVFSPGEVLKDDGAPYLMYTPYQRKWMERLKKDGIKVYPSERHLDRCKKMGPLGVQSLKDIGFSATDTIFPKKTISKVMLRNYASQRDFPAEKNGTSHLGLHLRFGTLSPRLAVQVALKESPVWLKEVVWREFFMMLLFHFPRTAQDPFKEKYAKVAWREDAEELKLWKEGRTGYPIVDAGMRELQATGFMHNRVRMITASFLSKHLMIHWKHGERHFADLLLDFELSSNVGNWQWVAGCGADAAPYFRVFNPDSQQKKFDPRLEYIKKWVPEFSSKKYPSPMVDHEFARRRALKLFREALSE